MDKKYNPLTMTTFELDSGTIKIHKRIKGDHKRYSVQEIDTKDRLIRDCLIALGWEPPIEEGLSYGEVKYRGKKLKHMTRQELMLVIMAEAPTRLLLG